MRPVDAGSWRAPDNNHAAPISPIWWTVFLYLLFASLWIALSDELLRIAALEGATIVRWSTAKGGLFVAVSSILLALLLIAYQRRNDRTQRELLRLSRKILSVQETERRRIAHELHDEIGQTLTAVQLSLESMLEDLTESQKTRLEGCVDLIDTLHEQIRSLSLDLRPTILDDVGLEAAIRWFVRRASTMSRPEIHLALEPLVPRPSSETETAAFRIAQEALTNVLRHADAENVWITTWRERGELVVEVEDDGRGFDVALTRRRGGRETLGIFGMEERASLAGGRMAFESEPAGGTRVRAALPENGAEPI